ncbi:MAG: deaminase [bacterium]
MEISHLKWSDLAFKKDLPFKLPFTFISGSREMTYERILELFKENIRSGDIVWGIYEEDYIAGFDGQIQFKTLDKSFLKQLENKIEKATIDRKIYFLKYSQKDSTYVIEKIKPTKAIFVNASWQGVFHRSDVFYKLFAKEIKYDLVSPFVDENEAKQYYKSMVSELNELSEIPINKGKKKLSTNEIFKLVEQVSKRSFDHTFQVALVLVKNGLPIEVSWNRVVPFETYSMHYGSLREKNFSPPGDLNNYDTIHSEMDILLTSLKKKIDLKGSSIYINLLPCPTCAKSIAMSDIETIYYKLDHSEGYALKLLTQMGKKCIRVE